MYLSSVELSEKLNNYANKNQAKSEKSSNTSVFQSNSLDNNINLQNFNKSLDIIDFLKIVTPAALNILKEVGIIKTDETKKQDTEQAESSQTEETSSTQKGSEEEINAAIAKAYALGACNADGSHKYSAKLTDEQISALEDVAKLQGLELDGLYAEDMETLRQKAKDIGLYDKNGKLDSTELQKTGWTDEKLELYHTIQNKELGMFVVKKLPDDFIDDNGNIKPEYSNIKITEEQKNEYMSMRTEARTKNPVTTQEDADLKSANNRVTSDIQKLQEIRNATGVIYTPYVTDAEVVSKGYSKEAWSKAEAMWNEYKAIQPASLNYQEIDAKYYN